MMKIVEAIAPDVLWLQFKSGDKAAFKAIYYKYYMELYRHGVKNTDDAELVEDCLQDMFLKLWKNRSSLGEVASVRSYLFRAFRRNLFEAINKSRRTYNGVELQMELADQSIEERIIASQILNEKKLHLHEALKRLTKRQKEVITLYYIEGLSYEQIAERIPLKYQAIRNVVHEGIKGLRSILLPSIFIIVCITFFFSF